MRERNNTLFSDSENIVSSKWPISPGFRKYWKDPSLVKVFFLEIPEQVFTTSLVLLPVSSFFSVLQMVGQYYTHLNDIQMTTLCSAMGWSHSIIARSHGVSFPLVHEVLEALQPTLLSRKVRRGCPCWEREKIILFREINLLWVYHAVACGTDFRQIQPWLNWRKNRFLCKGSVFRHPILFGEILVNASCTPLNLPFNLFIALLKTSGLPRRLFASHIAYCVWEIYLTALGFSLKIWTAST